MSFTLHTLDLPNTALTYHILRENIEWQQRNVRVFGKLYPQPRLTCWYGDVPYTYSGLTWAPKAMFTELERIRQRVEKLTGETFNSVLCNFYRTGADTIGWHADDEPLFGDDPVVASVSLGATRTFKLRRNDRSESKSFDLVDGSLFVMGRGVQREWQHSLPKVTSPTAGPRINLTFRKTI